MTPVKLCLSCGLPIREPGGKTRHAACKKQRRQRYDNPAYRKAAEHVRKTAQRCHLCGKGPIPGDPWEADHTDDDPDLPPLLPAHRSCNRRKSLAKHVRFFESQKLETLCHRPAKRKRREK